MRKPHDPAFLFLNIFLKVAFFNMIDGLHPLRVIKSTIFKMKQNKNQPSM